jgi:cation-transporting P-type ATPase E
VLDSANQTRRSAAGTGPHRPRRSDPSSGTSLKKILARNTFTWLNLILGTLGVATLTTGELPDAAFLLIAVINTVVGTVQEVRAKRTLDNLRVLSEPRARVHRDGVVVEIMLEELAVGDVVELRVGDQVAADGVVETGQAELDESVVTGESEPTAKSPGDPLVSGTWLVAGAISARVTAVGADSYASRLVAEAQRFSLTGSELVTAVNRILKVLLVLLALSGPLILWRQLQVEPWQQAVQGTTAALVGMVPEGLVLLTTLAFFAAAVRLSQRRVLVQELPAVEALARVDELCTDKTGTITQGRITWGGLVLPTASTDGASAKLPDQAEIEAALAALGSVQQANATLVAISGAVQPRAGWDVTTTVDFNSARKWSGSTFARQGTWIIGAPEMVTAADPGRLRPEVAKLASQGRRVLVVAQGRQALTSDDLPSDLRLVAAVELREQIRPDARATLDYFEAQGVKVRVVSGDSAPTVGAVAGEVGLPGADNPMDARFWPEDRTQVDDMVKSHTVFGRVQPEQKRWMVESLRRQGHVIAMTGDGVNDTLALKEADLGIAMGSGSPVARGVAQLVLLDDQFEVLPYVVTQGRQVLHNIETTASLFLFKNVWSFVVAIVVAIAGWPYPFLPRHLTLISAIGIGIPGFFLALGPSDERFRPGFLNRALRFAIPTGVVASAAIMLTYAIARAENDDPLHARTAVIIVTMVMTLWVLARAAQPWRPWKVALVASMAALYALAFLIPGIDTFLNLEYRPSPDLAVESIAIGLIASALMWLAAHLLEAKPTS